MSETTVEARRIFEVHEDRLAEAKALVAKANKKAGKYGLAGYSIVVSELQTRPAAGSNGGLVGFYEVEVVGGMPRFEGWSFVASIDHEEEVPITRPVPGVDVDLSGFRARTAECDYCGKSRKRSNVYVFAHEDGRLQQVGSSCLVPFFGVQVSAMLSWLAGDPIADLGDEPGQLRESSGGAARVEVKRLMTVACAAEQLSGFTSKAAAGFGKSPTISDALSYLFPSNSEADKRWVREMDAKADWVAAAAKAGEVLAWAAAQTESSEYMTNLRALASVDTIKAFGNSGLLVSAIGGYNRDKGLQAEREVAAVAEWVGEVDGKISVTGKVVMTRRIANTFGYNAPDRELVVVAGEVDGKPARLKWWASRVTGLTEGDQVTGVAKVTKHEEYEGKKETVVTRAKFEAVAG